MKIFGVLHGFGKEYEVISTVIESSMNNFSSHLYEFVVSQLTEFDDKLQSYATPSEVIPHLAFTVEQSYVTNYSKRGRGNRRFMTNVGRGSCSFSTGGRDFHQQINFKSSRS